MLYPCVSSPHPPIVLFPPQGEGEAKDDDEESNGMVRGGRYPAGGMVLLSPCPCPGASP